MSAVRNLVTTDKKPGPQPDVLDIHTLSVFVNNKPGVLARIAQTFSRRGFNIDSLVVSQGRDGRFSRMTIGVTGDPKLLNQIVEQVNKLIDVIHCHEHTPYDAVVRELAMIKIKADTDQRTEAFQLMEHFGARSVDLSDASMIIMVHGDSDKIDAMAKAFGKFEIIEVVRTGKVVMVRGEENT